MVEASQVFAFTETVSLMGLTICCAGVNFTMIFNLLGSIQSWHTLDIDIYRIHNFSPSQFENNTEQSGMCSPGGQPSVWLFILHSVPGKRTKCSQYQLHLLLSCGDSQHLQVGTHVTISGL